MSDEHAFISENIILMCICLIASVIISRIIDKLQITWLPASGAHMIFGFFVGIAVWIISPAEADFLKFSPQLFFFLLLPPIVFDAGYSMKRINFFRNLGSILLFAFAGTIISTFVIGFGLYGLSLLNMLDIEKDALDPLTFGALISSIDPIATLAILGNKSLQCDPLLYSLVFGESVLNDAIAITLYQTFIGFRTETSFGMKQLGGAMLQFTAVTFGSVAIGAVVALLCSYLLRKLNFTHHPSNEFIILFFSAYICYCLAELTHMSGIMALFICGVMQAHYAWYNISSISRTTTRHAFHAFAHTSEALLYVYFGISAFFSTQSDMFGYSWSLVLILWSTILCIISRALNIFPLSWLANLGRKRKISFKMQVIMWAAGLRGAISFALAIAMDSKNHGADQFITTTMVIIASTTLLIGGSSNWLLQVLGLTGSSESEEEESDDSELPTSLTLPNIQGSRSSSLSQSQSALQRNQSHIEINRRRRCCQGIDVHRTWVRLDQRIIQPWFGGKHAPKIIDYSAEHDHGAAGVGGDNSQMANPYIMSRVQETAKGADHYDNQLLAGKNSDDIEVDPEVILDDQGVPITNPDYSNGLIGENEHAEGYSGHTFIPDSERNPFVH